MTLLKIKLPFDERSTLSSGQYEIDLDNSKVKVTPEAIAHLQFPIKKTWAGKSWVIEAVEPRGDVLTVRVKVIQNPLPLMIVLSGLGLVGAGLVLIALVREIRRLVTLEDLRTPQALLLFGLVGLALVFGPWRKS